MSGTSYGACILHVSPEYFIGGPLALVRNGDLHRSTSSRARIDMDVCEAELAKRRAAWKKPRARFERGYGWMFTRHIKQANEGCDFDFLETALGAGGEPSIYCQPSFRGTKRTRNLEIPGSMLRIAPE